MYDARSSTGLDGGNMVFGLIAVVVVSAAFALSWFAAGLFNGSGSANGPSLAAAAPTAIDPALASTFAPGDEQRYVAALQQLDPNAYTALMGDYSAAGSRIEQLERLGTAGTAAIAANVELLGRLAPSDINAMIDMASAGLASARRANPALCQGSTYTRFEGMSPQAVEQEFAAMGIDRSKLMDQTLGGQADFLEILVRTRRAPQSHGKLTPQDEVAIQNMIIKMMNDPALLQLAMLNGSDLSALERVDLCQVGESLLREVRALPDGTKARALSSALSMPEVRTAISQADALGF